MHAMTPSEQCPSPRTGSTWRDRNMAGWVVTADSLEKLLGEAEAFAKSAITGKASGEILIMTGPPQTGKTRLGRQVLMFWRHAKVRAWELGHWGDSVPSVGWCNWSDFAEIDPRDRDGAWDDVAKSDLAVIDDLGSEVDRFKSGRPTENLRLMLEDRFKGKRATVITTNISPKEFSTRWDSRVGGRLARARILNFWNLTPFPIWEKTKRKNEN